MMDGSFSIYHSQNKVGHIFSLLLSSALVDLPTIGKHGRCHMCGSQVGIFQVMLLQRSAEKACSLLQKLEPYMPFRDPSRGPSCFDLQVYDCVRVGFHPSNLKTMISL